LILADYFNQRDQESATQSGLIDDFRTHGQRPHGARFTFGTMDRVDSGYASEDFKGRQPLKCRHKRTLFDEVRTVNQYARVG